MKRLVWVAVGVAATVVVVRAGRVLIDRYVPREAVAAVDGAARTVSAVRTARSELRAGMAERERELRAALLGDLDVDELRRQAPAARAGLRAAWRGRAADDESWNAAHAPDDSDEDGYAFF